ncbi:hypothetical protein [Burkholderia sp. LAS2]|uniref:hypothetical protein n=1 Tax=Burkholderia sp. LAS2 TaxID=2813843 RepID=UPI001BCDC296|nr:hypothetical protein [Burkholderia sp. LAS2]QVN10312.1 hypothetical protein JYG37_13295 [Burkholderia sp. LAS2]
MTKAKGDAYCRGCAAWCRRRSSRPARHGDTERDRTIHFNSKEVVLPDGRTHGMLL